MGEGEGREGGGGNMNWQEVTDAFPVLVGVLRPALPDKKNHVRYLDL